MTPIFIIAPPRARATLLVRMLNATPGITMAGEGDKMLAALRGLHDSRERYLATHAAETFPRHHLSADDRLWDLSIRGALLGWVGAKFTDTHFGIRSTFLGREGWESAVAAWSWMLKTWPAARMIFLTRDQGEIELSMLVTHSLGWIPEYGKCGSCAGGRVKRFLESMGDFHDLNPTRTALIDSAELLEFETASSALGRLGIPLDRAAWESQIAIVSGSYKEFAMAEPAATDEIDPFHPTAKWEVMEKHLPQAPQIDPFASDTQWEALAELPAGINGAKPNEEPVDKNPLRLVVPRRRYKSVPGSDLVIYTLRYGDADWIAPCLKTLEAWSARHGYEIRTFGKPEVELPDEKFLTIQMMREFLKGDANWMLFIDADVLIHPSAPAWPRLAGFAAAWDEPMNMKHWNRWLKKHYPNLPVSNWIYRNTGVWSIDRASAEIFLREVDATPVWNTGVREQHQFNAWMIFAGMRGMRTPILSNDWNNLAKYGAKPAWFQHLAGKSDVKSKYIEKLYKHHLMPRPPREFPLVEPRSPRAIVYPWLPSYADWDELRYSLRSLEMHFEDKECPIYILGDTPPRWLKENSRVQFLRMDGYSRSKQEGLFQARCTGYQIAEKVLWFNDDIYLLKPQGWEDFEVALTEGNLTKKEHKLLEGNAWERWMGGAVADLRHTGHSPVLRFATHTPVLYQFEKVREILRRFYVPHKGGFAILYHNFHLTPHRPCGPDKVRNLPAPETARFLNHSAGVPTEEIRSGLQAMFPTPAPWEKPEFVSSAADEEAGNVRLCVASFGEDLAWLSDAGFPACAYDATGKNPALLSVPNEAREASQYLRHIIANYGRFANYELFLQGNPFDHSPRLYEKLVSAPWSGKRVYPLGGINTFSRFNLIDHNVAACKMADELGLEMPEGTLWPTGAIFAASREALMSRSLAWWEALLEKVVTEKETSPWAIERLWIAILSEAVLTSPGNHAD
jgi:hypothetical protein